MHKRENWIGGVEVAQYLAFCLFLIYSTDNRGREVEEKGELHLDKMPLLLIYYIINPAAQLLFGPTHDKLPSWVDNFIHVLNTYAGSFLV